MAMNWPQLVKPRACRSAWCSLTAFSNSPREKLQHLRENAAYFIHRLSLLKLGIGSLVGTQSSLPGAQPFTASLNPHQPSSLCLYLTPNWDSSVIKYTVPMKGGPINYTESAPAAGT